MRLIRGNLRPAARAGVALAAALPITALLFGLGGCSGAGARGGGEAPVVKLDYEKYTLPNGLDVILRKDGRLPLVAVNLWYHVGPAKEVAGRTGFAHLFEHMMFQGSGHTEDDTYFKHLEGAGASFVNGTTDFDRTNYMEDVPANQLELALWLESDRMGFLLDKLDQGMLSNQQDVVRNERRQGIENAPYGLPQEEAYHLLFAKDHPYHAMVMGSHEDIQAAKLEDVRDFFTKYYAPNNASLAIVGDIDVAKTKAMVEKYFGTIPRGPAVEPVNVQTAPITEERRAVVTDRVELPRVYMAWITAPIFKPGDAEAGVAAHVLGGGKASRLYKSLVYEKKIAQSVDAEQQSLALGSVFQITATAKPGHTAEELEAAIDAELDTLATRGPTDQELSAAKNSILSDIVMNLENLGGFTGVADRLNYYNQHVNDPGYLNKDLKRYSSVTAAGVKEVAASALKKNARVVVAAIPGEKKVPPGPPTPPAPPKTATKVEAKEPWRSTMPKPGPLPTTPLARAKQFKLANGLTVYLVESHALPVVSAQLVVRSGSAADPAELPGLAGFSVAMLDEGTAKRDALGIARDLESLGASLGMGSTNDGSTITLQTLKKNATAATEIMADVAFAPTFPEKEIERVRNDRITAILQQRDSPFQTALRVLLPALYGPAHPYGHVTLGTEDALKKMTRDDLVKFYKAAFAPEAGALVLAGDLTESEARKVATEGFGAWRGTGAAAAQQLPGTTGPERVLIVDKPGNPQTLVLLAQLGVARSDPDFEKLNAMNQILGGLFTSRINLNLREKHGYSYGAFSGVVENRGVGPIYAASSVRTDATGPSIREMMSELNGMLAAPVSADELALAKESISRSLPALFETTQSTVGTIGGLFLYELPPDYYEGLPARLDAMTAAEIFEATKKHLAPEKMIVIAVGDRKVIEPQIATLKLGTIGYRTPDGKPAGMAAAMAR
jgi:zinc protease